MLANVTLWNGKYAEALAMYDEFLTDDFDRDPKIWESYLEAAARSTSCSAGNVATADRIITKLEGKTENSMLLAWCWPACLLHRQFEEKLTLPLEAAEMRALLQSPILGPWEAVVTIVADRGRMTPRS